MRQATVIHILYRGVTLDLRGFSINGTDTAQTAIVTTGDSVIRNGQLNGWGTGVASRAPQEKLWT